MANRSYGACIVACSLLALARPSAAQTDADLDAARKLFGEAYEDEQKANFATALDKYRTVLQTKETANVRYRMGACLEGLGKRRAAAREYERAVAIGASDPPSEEVILEAQHHIDALAKQMGTVSLHGPPNAAIAIDAEKVDDVSQAVWLDAGEHVVSATASSKEPFQSRVFVREGQHLDVAIDMKDVKREELPHTSSSGRTIAGVTLVSVGALTIGGGAISLVVRQTSITAINEACPSGVCNESQREEIESKRNTALVAGPLGGILLGVGAAAAIGGIVLLAMSPSSNVSVSLGGLEWHGRF